MSELVFACDDCARSTSGRCGRHGQVSFTVALSSPRQIDGATRGIRCAAKSDLGDWCSRDAGHPGAHESRNPRGRGLVGWWNEEYLR